MNDDFKDKFKKYSDGKLSEDNRKEFELELEKLEDYQELIEEYLGSEPKEIRLKDKPVIKNQAKLLGRGKWRARVQNAVTTIVIVVVVIFLCKFLTEKYYSTGTPNRAEKYEDVVKSIISITQPNVNVNTVGSTCGTFFTLNMNAELSKTVGKEEFKVGEMNIEFSFNRAGITDRKWNLINSPNHAFLYPKGSTGGGSDSDWKKFEMLDEGTVSEAFISLDKFYEVDEILQKLKDKELRPLWYAVDTGVDGKLPDGTNFIAYSVGFPEIPIFNHESFSHDKLTHSVSYSMYNNGKQQSQNFIDTLKFLNNYEAIANVLGLEAGLDLQRRLDYIDKNGIKIYGIVVTGPTKEILKLKSEPWVANVKCGEVEFWNWN